MDSTATFPHPNGNVPPAYQTNTYIWGLRFIQLLFALIIVGLGGSAISEWHSVGCSSPSKLSFNFAIALITIFLLLYFILSSGPHKRPLPWYSLYATLGLETLFIILYIVAAALSTYDCSGLCNVCTRVDQGFGYFVWANELSCFCWLDGDDLDDDFYDKRDAPSNIFARGGRPVSGGRSSGTGNAAALGKTLEKGFSSAAKKGLDATMILLFLISLTTLLYMRYSKRSEAQAQLNGEHAAEQVSDRMDGAFQMGGIGNGPSVGQVI